jgi:hypothetical protein
METVTAGFTVAEAEALDNKAGEKRAPLEVEYLAIWLNEERIA